MRVVLICFGLQLALILNVLAQVNPFFSYSRQIKYKIHYGFLNAGTLEISSDTQSYLIENRKCYKMAVLGQTTGTAAAFAKIKDRWITYVDTSIGYPFRFIRELQENKYSKEELTEFDRKNNLIVVSTKSEEGEYQFATYTSVATVHDMVSAYLALHSTKLAEMKKRDTLSFPVFVEDSTYQFRMVFLGKEKVRTEYGKKMAYKLSPLMPDNTVFSKEEAILCWISADEEQIPLKVKAKLIVGSVELDLEEYNRYGK